MFLRRLVVDDLRAFEHVEIDFSSAGGGRTTVLRAIALVTAGTEALAGLRDEWQVR